MQIPGNDFQHVSTAAHQGRIILFAVDRDRAIRYRVKHEPPKESVTGYLLTAAGLSRLTRALSERGYDLAGRLDTLVDHRFADEPAYLDAVTQKIGAVDAQKFREELVRHARTVALTHWTEWQMLALPHDPPDESVLAHERMERIDGLVASVYDSHKRSALAPIRAVSEGGHLHVFRQSLTGTLLVDRFVLDGAVGRLNRTIEVRYKRSGKRHTPLNGGGGRELDSRDFRDTSGNFFLEPSAELRLIDGVEGGRFAVVMTPTHEHEKLRWHIFTWDAAGKRLRIVSLLKTEEARFDLRDWIVTEGDAEQPTYRGIPGIVRHTVELRNAQGRTLALRGGLTAVVHDVQRELVGDDGENHLVKVERRVVVAAPTDDEGKIVALNFGVRRDGSLAPLDLAHQDRLLIERHEDLRLPPNVLARLESWHEGTREPPPAEERAGLVFTGGEQHVQTRAALALAGTSFTIEMWMRHEKRDQAALAFGQGVPELGRGLHIGPCGVMFRFSFHRADVLDTPLPDDAGWHHWACVHVLGGARQIFLDGVKVAEDQPSGPYIGSGEPTIGRVPWGYPFVGELADVRVWRRARSAADIQATMNRRLTGRELGLVAHWPLDVVVDGAVYNTVTQVAGLLVGGVYRSGRRLSRTLADGVTLVDRYRNPALVPVAERADYLESFELHADANRAPFDFIFWGETVTGETTAPVRVPALLDELPDGWVRARARFVTPPGMIRLRALEFAPPGGTWTPLVIRNHSLAQLRATVTEASHAGTASLTELAPQADQLVRIAGQLDGLEAREALLIRRLRALDDTLARSTADLNADIDRKRAALAATEQDVAARARDRDLMERHLTYGGTVALRANNSAYQAFLCVEGAIIKANRAVAAAWETFTILDAFAPDNAAAVHYGDWVAFRAHTGKYLLADNPTWPSTTYYWVRAVYEAIGAYERWQILNPDDPSARGPVPRGGKVAFMSWRRDYGHKYMLCGTSGTWRQDVWCEYDGIHADGRFDGVHLSDGPGVEAARRRHVDSLPGLSRCRDELATAQRLLQDATADRARVQAERDDVDHQLTDLQTRISGDITAHLAATRAIDNADLTMPQLGGAAVRGALLGFARTTTDPTAADSLEGALHLYFIDNEGRLRRCDHDAVAQRWRVDTLGSSLRMRGQSTVEIPHHPAFSSATFTIEMWVRWHGAGTDIHFLIGKGFEELEIHTGGSVPDGLRFIPASGVYVDTAEGALPRGEWVHVACVYAGEPGTAEIYLDGRRATLGRADAKMQQNPTSSSLVLGCRAGGSFRFSGDMSDVRLWNVALTQDEIVAQMHLPLSGHEPGLVGHWPLGEGEGAVARDRSINGQHGTITNPIWYPSTAPIGRPRAGSRQVLGFARQGEVTIPHHPAYQSAAFTIEARVRWTRSGSDIDFIFGKGTSELELHTGGAVPGGLRFIPVPNVFLDTPNDALCPGAWVDIACVYTGDPATSRIYLDGSPVPCRVTNNILGGSRSDAPLHIGSRHGGEFPFSGQICEVRMWSRALSPEEVAVNRALAPSHGVPGLVGYWPLDEGGGEQARDLSPLANHGTIVGPRFIRGVVATRTVLAGEYGSVDVAQGQPQALLRRLVAWPMSGGVEMLLGHRVDALELRWLGNAQMNPTLVGYIEGAPPVPSENLTVQEDYNGASSVEFKVADETTTTFTHDLTAGVGLSLEVANGFYLSGNVGVSLIANKEFAYTVKAVSQLKFAASASFLNNYSTTKTKTVTTSETLALKGEREAEVSLPRLGRRFIPKNVGYATVVSTLADVFALRTRGGKRMIGYQFAPVKDVPPDVNVVTFMINPAYTLNGSLDGQVGSSAADARFYDYVPEARSRYGSELPASYYRLREAYALKDAIDRSNRGSEASAINLTSNLLNGMMSDTGHSTPTDEEAVKAQAASQTRGATDAAVAGMNKLSSRQVAERMIEEAPKANIVNTYVWDGDGGLRVQAQTFASSWQNVLGGSLSAEIGLGKKLEVAVPGIALDFNAMFSINLTETLTQATANARAVELNVTVDCERQGITDNKDRPLVPGEKVDRYRFMSFALEPATGHFTDFFARVVDPEWLASDDEEARVLRRIDQGTPNKTWRVLHRVTYVERPIRIGEG